MKRKVECGRGVTAAVADTVVICIHQLLTIAIRWAITSQKRTRGCNGADSNYYTKKSEIVHKAVSYDKVKQDILEFI